MHGLATLCHEVRQDGNNGSRRPTPRRASPLLDPELHVPRLRGARDDAAGRFDPARRTRADEEAGRSRLPGSATRRPAKATWPRGRGRKSVTGDGNQWLKFAQLLI